MPCLFDCSQKGVCSLELKIADVSTDKPDCDKPVDEIRKLMIMAKNNIRMTVEMCLTLWSDDFYSNLTMYVK